MPSKEFPVSILQKSVKMTNEPPSGLKANLLRSYTSFSDSFLSDSSKPVPFRRLLYSLCFFHAQLLERRRYPGVGFNIPYDWNDSDRKVSVQHLHLLLDRYEEVPFEALVFLLGQIHFGGRVTDHHDFPPVMALLHQSFNQEVLTDQYCLVPGDRNFQVPMDGTLDEYIKYIQNLPSYHSSPEVFGLHSNAQIVNARHDTFSLLDLSLSLQPRSTGGASGPVVSVESVAEGILNFLPAVYNIEEVGVKYPLSYLKSMNTVLVQELMRFNGLISVIKSTLSELLKALKGVVVMSAELDQVCSSLLANKVPSMWADKAYPSLKSLDSWFEDLLLRLKFLQSWIDNGSPSCFWISGLFFPQGFLTGTLQNYARKYKIPIDSISFEFHVLDKTKEEITSPPAEGCYVYGLYLDGARWDLDQKLITDALPKQLYNELPVIWFKPVLTKEKKIADNNFKCPVYKTAERRGTLSTTGHSTNFVLYVDLPCSKSEQFWYLRGTGALCQLP
ncbi:hypothetical protein GEMRC1_001833 [Eukaryota sp. GEM-RC1]